MRRPVVLLATAAALAAAVGVLVWLEPWYSDRDRELSWVRGYVAWRDAVDGSLESTAGAFRDCEGRLPEAPTERTREAAAIAERACRRLAATPRFQVPPPDAVDAWYEAGEGVHTALFAVQLRRTPPQPFERAARAVAGLAGGREPEVLCWDAGEWRVLEEELQLLQHWEYWLSGLAEKGAFRIHLSPWTCEPLRRFLLTRYAPFGHEGAYDLAQALVTLVHEAEHLRSPDAVEADVECVALQRVREFVRGAGRGDPYADEMAGLAWEIGYPDEPEEYRTATCRDGGPLDVRPDDPRWP